MRPLLASLLLAVVAAHAEPLTLGWTPNFVSIRGRQLPGEINIHYLEAYCRAGSTDADWVKHTKVSHTSKLISATAREIKLRDTVADGLIVEHTITAKDDEVDFRVVAHNPANKPSEIHWAQPCVRLSKFLGFPDETARTATDYLPKSFIFLDGKLTRMPRRNGPPRPGTLPVRPGAPNTSPAPT